LHVKLATGTSKCFARLDGANECYCMVVIYTQYAGGMSHRPNVDFVKLFCVVTVDC